LLCRRLRRDSLGESFVDHQRIKTKLKRWSDCGRGGLGILRAGRISSSDPFVKDLGRTICRFFQGWRRMGRPAAGNLWGSNQAALSLAIWSSTAASLTAADVHYPLTLHERVAPILVRNVFPHPRACALSLAAAADAIRANLYWAARVLCRMISGSGCVRQLRLLECYCDYLPLHARHSCAYRREHDYS